MVYNPGNIGRLYLGKGDFDKALDYYTRSLKMAEDIGDESRMEWLPVYIGIVYYYKGDSKKAVKYLEKSFVIQKETRFGGKLSLWTTTYLYLTYKKLGKAYDKKKLQILIKKDREILFDLNFGIFQLLEDTSYLETAYNQVQEKADNLEPDVAAKFLSYPIPKAIVEKWEKVK
jgi:tetratricopeptide (TPR) repeat protein